MVSPVLSFEETMALLTPVSGPRADLPAEIEVAIIGAGTAGLTAANLLGHMGVKVVLVERNARTSDLPRAIAVDDEYMRLLDRLGLGPDLDGHISKPFGVHFTSPLGFALVAVPGFITPNGFGNRNAVSQPMFEKILLQGVQRFAHVHCRFGASVTQIAQDKDGVTITLADKDGQPQTIRAKYVFACDGARSFVRQHLGIPFEGASLDQPHLVVDLAEVGDQAGFSRFICNPRRPLNAVLGPYGGRRLEFMLLPGDDHATIASDESIRMLVDKHTPYKGMPLKIIRRAIYGLAERMAARLQQDRVFLLGDAAHIMPPFGAQGMNTGARDGANLAWKIAGVLSGTLPVTALATYDLERREHIRQTIDYSVRIGKLANIRFWPLAVLRDACFALVNLSPAVRRYFAEMRYLPKPVIKDGLLVHDTGMANSPVGRLLPRWLLRTPDGQQTDIDAETDLQWALIGVNIPRDALTAFATNVPWMQLSPRLISISSSLEYGYDFEFDRSRAGPLFDALRGHIIILRPDNVVAGVAMTKDFAAVSDALAIKLYKRNEA